VNDTVFDIVVIGAGPGGYVAAIQAAHRGLKTALIESRQPGGVCLNAGCIPTKAMLAGVELLRQARKASPLGVRVDALVQPWPAILDHRNKVVQQLLTGLQYLLDKNGVQLIRGRGILTSAAEIEVRGGDDTVVQTIRNPKAIILATGSRPASMPHLPADGVRILSSHDLLFQAEPPKSIVIVGGGYIGCEFASMLAPLGVQVTIVEGLTRLLPGMEKELGLALARSYQKEGIKIILNTTVAQAQPGLKTAVTLSNGQVIEADQVLVSIGRKPNIEDIGLENAGVTCDAKGISIDAAFQTSVPGIYAIGDVTGKMALAHVASAQARWLIGSLQASIGGGSVKQKAPIDYDAIPACVFTHPEIAAVGLSEEAAVSRGLAVKTSRFPFSAIGKAIASGETDGFVKLVADASTGKLLGGHIIGAQAAEMIAALSVAIGLGATIAQLIDAVFAHPTLSEAIHEAAEGMFGQPTHMIARR
jgi:dihydrolipoamide dehydrogenase